MGRQKLTFSRSKVESLPEHCSIRKAARTLGVSLMAVQKWIGAKKNALPVSRNGNGFLHNIKRSSLVAWLVKTGRYDPSTPRVAFEKSKTRKFPYSVTVRYASAPDRGRDAEIRRIASKYKFEELGSGYSFGEGVRDIEFAFKTGKHREKFCRDVKASIAVHSIKKGRP